MNTTPTTPLPDLNPDLAAYFPPPDLWAETLSMGTDALRREKRDMILQECRILTVAALARRVLLDAGGDFPDTDPPLFSELPRPAFGTPPGRHLRMMLEAARAAMLGEGQGELAAALERLQDAATYPKGPEDAGGRSLAQEAARAVLFELQMAFLKVRHWRGVLFGLLCGRLGMEALKTRVLYALHKATPAPSSPQTQGETESDNAAVVMGCGALLARIAADAAAAKHAAAGAHAEAARGRLAAEDAAAAGRAAEAAAHTTGEHIMATIHTATAQLEERKRKRDSAEAVVEACKRFADATNDEAGAQIDIMEGVLGDMVEEGWTIADWPASERQTMLALQARRSVSRRFLKHWRVWRQMKPRPRTGAEYASAKAAKKARARKAKKAD